MGHWRYNNRKQQKQKSPSKKRKRSTPRPQYIPAPILMLLSLCQRLVNFHTTLSVLYELRDVFSRMIHEVGASVTKKARGVLSYRPSRKGGLKYLLIGYGLYLLVLVYYAPVVTFMLGLPLAAIYIWNPFLVVGLSVYVFYMYRMWFKKQFVMSISQKFCMTVTSGEVI